MIVGLNDVISFPLTKKINDHNGKVESYFYKNIDHIGIISALSIPYRYTVPIVEDINAFIKNIAR